jgi:3-deoxy-7-phosphoheptulonate synthase
LLLFTRKDQPAPERAAVLAAARDAGFLVQPVGDDLIVLFGDGDASALEGLPGVDRIEMSTLAPERTRRGARTGTTPVDVGGVAIGSGLSLVAGPCAVEDRARLADLAAHLKSAGADLLRGGAFKPRTSPYSFRGLGEKGLVWLREAGDAAGLPVVTEVLDTRDVAVVADHADMLQIGTRNMMNYALLVEAGRAGRPVLLKRGMSATFEEFLCAVEYLLLEGCPGVVLCERGIRTFNDSIRNTLDLSAVPVLRRETHLPVCVDPSHATGRRELVPSMARAAVAAGAHAVMMEVHDDPAVALSDGRQAILPQSFPALVKTLREIHSIVADIEEEEAE